MTENGMVRGLAGNNARITVFKGIPFAAPPVGDLRWKAPQPAADWEGVLEAYKFGPISMQDVPGLSDDIYVRDWHVDPEIDMDEDCLYLNIWSNAKSADENGSSEADSSGDILPRWSLTAKILPREALS